MKLSSSSLTVRTAVAALALAGTSLSAHAQSAIYPQHFDLSEVTLTAGPFKNALEVNNKLLLEYDTDRLLTPFVRQAGLSKQPQSKYYGWEEKHPSFKNWGLDSWSLEGHVGGHYITALALAYAATRDEGMKNQLKTRLDYVLGVLNDCQRAYDNNTEGMRGFLGGQPINEIWTGLYARNLAPFKKYGYWVPFYCEHKTLAGLRDAWLYTGSKLAKKMFKDMCDWSLLVVSNLSESEMQDILGFEHGGMNEPLADAYRIFGEQKYLDGAKKYSHRMMIDGMQTLNPTFLDGKHANTQVPKYIGFERIYQEANSHRGAKQLADYEASVRNFWTDVAQNRTVAIGGNSVDEHFLSVNNSHRYIDRLDGPESCNSNNMLKLSEILFDDTHDARYADFYEGTMWNHILSTQDPQTGGYVYFTSLRPQSYRIYSQVNQGMWCCVGTGMENHSKYGHFVYTHSEDNKTLYINLFTPSVLASKRFVLTQETAFPEEQKTRITLHKGGQFTLAVRHPAWAGSGFAVRVNGQQVATSARKGEASYVNVSRKWKKGDVVEVLLPMELRYEECPNYSDFIAFKYGPLLLAAPSTATSAATAAAEGLPYERLQNEYGGEGRMDHAPGTMGKALSLSSSPLLIGSRSNVLSRIKPTSKPLTFTIDASSTQSKGHWTTLQLVPFYSIQHARYTCYWYQQMAEGYAKSSMGRADALAEELAQRTIDFVSPGEQQSEAGHDALYDKSGRGDYRDETYRDAQTGGFIAYMLNYNNAMAGTVKLLCRFNTADRGRRATITIGGQELAEITIPERHEQADDNGFFNMELPIPATMLVDKDGKKLDRLAFRLVASADTMAPGIYDVRLMK